MRVWKDRIVFLIGKDRLRISRVEYVLDDYLDCMSERGRTISRRTEREIRKIREDNRYIANTKISRILYHYIVAFIEHGNGRSKNR